MTSQRPFFFSTFFSAIRQQQHHPTQQPNKHTTTTPSAATAAAASSSQSPSSSTSTSRAVSAQPPNTSQQQQQQQQQGPQPQPQPQQQSSSGVVNQRPLHSPRGGIPIPNPANRRRGSDSSSEGFREVLGADKWYVGGRTATGEERYFKLGVIKRVKSNDGFSLDRLSL